jgi:hypothetical protein
MRVRLWLRSLQALHHILINWHRVIRLYQATVQTFAGGDADVRLGEVGVRHVAGSMAIEFDCVERLATGFALQAFWGK